MKREMSRKNFTPRTETIISPAGSLNNLFGDGRTLIIELEKVGLEQALCESVVAGDRLGNVSGICKCVCRVSTLRAPTHTRSDIKHSQEYPA